MASYLNSTTTRFLVGLILTAYPQIPRAYGCSTCGCLLNREWVSEGFTRQPGFKSDLIYTYIDQHQLRSGTQKIAANEVPVGQELEDYTRTLDLTLDLAYVINADWRVSWQLPYIVRDHATFGTTHSDYDTSSTSNIGDTNVVASYEGLAANHHLGVTLGVNLPSGSFTKTFRSGDPLDRGLQPGTGTTGIIGRVYYYNSFTQDWGYFGQASTQAALNYRAGYHPGTTATCSLGARYTGQARVTPQLQINTKIADHDQGDQADFFNSGGSSVDLSPGITVDLTTSLSTYATVHFPLYQNLNGYALVPTWMLTLGIHSAF